MSSNAIPLTHDKSIEQSPNKFLLYGITYLLVTPSHFSELVKDGPIGSAKIVQFLLEAGIEEEAHHEIMGFAQSIALDLKDIVSQVRQKLQSDFGVSSYSPTPCPSYSDCVSIMQQMNELRKASLRRLKNIGLTARRNRHLTNGKASNQ